MVDAMSGIKELSLPIEGRFWDPADDSVRVRGRVIWPGRWARLELEEPLRRAPTGSNPLQAIQAQGREEAELIAGRSLTGMPLCLTDCYVTQMKGAEVPHPQRWTAARVFIGASAPPAKVARLDVQLHGLRDFYGDPLLGEFGTVPDGDRDRMTVDWKSSPTVELLFGEVTLRFEDEMQGAGTNDLFTLVARPRIHIVPPQPRTLDELRPEIEYLATLVSFCRGVVVELDELWLVTVDDSRVRCLERLRPLSEHAGERTDAWLRLGNLTPLPETFGRWRQFCITNANSASMIAQYLRDPPRHMTIDRLLVLARFMEEYTHTSIESGAMPKKNDGKRWTFRSVVRFFMDQHSVALGGAMGPDHGQVFPKAVADTRNYHTHFNPKLAAKAARDLDLVVLIDRMWCLTRAIVLSELGYDDEQVAQMLGNDPHVSWLTTQP
jgi:hypothetical protein